MPSGASAAARITTPAAAGIQLTAEEQQTASAAVRPGTRPVTVSVTPRGCEPGTGCGTRLTVPGHGDALSAATSAADDGSASVAPLNGATVKVLEEGPKVASEAAPLTTLAYEPRSVPEGAVACPDLPKACWWWQIAFAGRAWHDGDWVWGGYSRYGKTGTLSTTLGETHYSEIELDSKEWRLDPNRTSLYGTQDFRAKATIEGIPIASKTSYVHLWWRSNGQSWAVI